MPIDSERQAEGSGRRLTAERVAVSNDEAAAVVTLAAPLEVISSTSSRADLCG